jgi:hypothetical protein
VQKELHEEGRKDGTYEVVINKERKNVSKLGRKTEVSRDRKIISSER